MDVRGGPLKIKLTPSDVKKLPPSSSDYFDTVAPGLVLRVTPGSRSFAVVFSWRGKTQRAPIGPISRWELPDAREEARRLLRMKDAGVNPAEERRQERTPALTIEKLVEQCLAAIAVSPGTATEYKRLAEVELVPALGQLQAPQLDRRRIREWSRAIAARAPYVANRAFGLLRRVYAWALDEDLVEASPFYGLRPPAAERSSDRVLTVPELLLLLRALEALPGQYSDAVTLLLLTCTRREMVVGMRKAELDLEAQEPRWTVPPERVKGGRPHVVPLSAAAVELLERRLEIVDDVLFPPIRAARSDVMAWQSKYVLELKRTMEEMLWCDKSRQDWPAPVPENEDHPRESIPRWTVHSIRHTATTHMIEELGVDDRITSLLLGHRPAGPSKADLVYNRAQRLPERRVALVAWADWLGALRRGERPKVVGIRRA